MRSPAPSNTLEIFIATLAWPQRNSMFDAIHRMESSMNVQPSRRQAIQYLSALAPLAILNDGVANDSSKATDANDVDAPIEEMGPYPSDLLPEGARSRFVNGINGLRMHVLEAGFEEGGRPGVLLLHGFPELAYSWRRVMVPLAKAGYHVIAPDQRGYGRTTGWERDYDVEIDSFRLLSLAGDALALVYAMGHRQVSVVGHDFGSPVAGWCALTRPDVFTKVALMSAPFTGPAELPFDMAIESDTNPSANYDLYAELAKLSRPRKHYQQYYRTREANENMWQASQGLHDFLRAYFHFKSADWEGNQPHRLSARTAEAMAQMPTYYIMNLNQGMAETVTPYMPSEADIENNQWLPDAELQVYTDEYERIGFQGGLNWYRASILGASQKRLFAGKRIEQPSLFVSGASDWGVYQNTGAFERMQNQVCSDLRGVHLLEGAGHWVQQEQSEKTARLLIDFLKS